MRIVKNENLIRRNGKIGQWSSIAGLVVLAGGMYLSLQRPELFSYSIVALLGGFGLTQISMYFGNRFGRSPRPDERLDAALKGLPGDFVLHHYTTSVPHLLVGPAGIWILLPYHQRGRIAYHNSRWRLSGGGFLQSYLRFFGQEGIGRPELEAERQMSALKKQLGGRLADSPHPDIRALAVFTSDEVEVDAGQSLLPALKTKQLKDFMRQAARERTISPVDLGQIQKVLAGP
jgi:hypothetical protein